MLTISPPLGASQARAYHREEFANAQENYYSEGDRIHGQWHGKLGERFGLSGEVQEEHFARLAEGQHPQTSEQLVRHQTPREYLNARGEKVKTVEHRAGWDATFSAPKTVSLTGLVGHDQGVLQDHRESVSVALDALEHYVQARMGGNRPAVTTGEWVAARFEHDSARPVNGYAAPQLHTHVVVFNLTELPDGEHRALQPHELFKAQQYGTAVYRSELALRLERRGYEIERGAHGQPEIKGFSREYLEKSSPRSEQIQAHLKEQGVSGARAAQIAAHQTRDDKLELSRDVVQRQHQEMAATFGHQPQRVVSEAQQRMPQAASLEKRERAVDGGLRYARERNLERQAVAGERELLKDALKRSMGEASLADVRRNLEQRVATGELVQVEGKGIERVFTTPEMQGKERATIAVMRAGRERYGELAREETRRFTLGRHAHLNESQRVAVERVLSNRDRIMGLDGIAGAGKTTCLSAIREGAEREGYEVHGLAPTSGATRELKKAGVESSTLQRHLAHGDAGPSGQRRLYVLDESSLTSTKQMHAFVERLGERDRVLLVGDVRQHEAVDAGRPFRQLQDEGMQTARLTEIVRQRDPRLKEVVEQLARGEVRQAIRNLGAQGRVHEIPDRAERLQAIARTYATRPAGTLVVSPDNESRRELNRLIHSERQRLGQVDGAEHRVRVLVSRQELTGPDRAWAGQYQPGDVVRYTKGSKTLGLDAGEYARVERVDQERNLVTIARASGELKTYDPRRLQGVAVYQEGERVVSRGERVQFTAPSRELGIANREQAVVERIEKNGDLTLRLDSGRTLAFNVREHPHLDLGYAVTSYSGQGQTAGDVLVHVDTTKGVQLVNNRFAYVAASRARDDLQIFTNDKGALALQLGRDVSHASALGETAAQGVGVAAKAPSLAAAVPAIAAKVVQKAVGMAVSAVMDLAHGMDRE
jgi:conjugative relaxase-like TrwC/TraI family protein